MWTRNNGFITVFVIKNNVTTLAVVRILLVKTMKIEFWTWRHGDKTCF
jgi:hypothetical protein